jgi:hypothetical protein
VPDFVFYARKLSVVFSSALCLHLDSFHCFLFSCWAREVLVRIDCGGVTGQQLFGAEGVTNRTGLLFAHYVGIPAWKHVDNFLWSRWVFTGRRLIIA